MPSSWKCWIYWISHEKTQSVLQWGLCQQPAKGSGGLYVHVRGEQSTPTAWWASANSWPSPTASLKWGRSIYTPADALGVGDVQGQHIFQEFNFPLEKESPNHVELESEFSLWPLCSTFSCICLNLARTWRNNKPKCFGKYQHRYPWDNEWWGWITWRSISPGYPQKRGYY